MKMSNDNGGFEREWEKAFQNSEISPPSKVWDNIEAELDSKKKRVFIPWYKITVAASLFIAGSLGIYFGLQNMDQDNTSLSVDLENSIHSNDQESSTSSNVQENSSKSIDQENNTNTLDQSLLSDANEGIRHSENDFQSSSSIQEDLMDSSSSNSDVSSSATETSEVDASSSLYAIANSNSASSNSVNLNPDANPVNGSEISLPENSNNGGDFLMSESLQQEIANGNEAVASTYLYKYELAYEENIGLTEPEFSPTIIAQIPEVYRGYELLPKEDEKKTVFIAGLNFSTGRFSPNVASLGNGQLEKANFLRVASSEQFSMVSDEVRSVYPGYDIEQFEELQPSIAFSYGANVGFAITKRIIVYGGLNYVQANSILNTDLVITQNGQALAASFYSTNGINDRQSSADNYDIQNGFEFLSIPVKAGYAIVNKDFNVTILGGVSTEFLLSNSYSSSESGFNEINSFLNEGSEEVYNPVYFNGLLGLNVGYTFAERYLLYVEPSFRKAISQFTKEEFQLQSSPSYKMMMVGLSYRF